MTFLLHKNWNKLGPVSSYVVSEQMGFLKFIKRKSTSEMDCPDCGGTMLPLDLKN